MARVRNPKVPARPSREVQALQTYMLQRREVSFENLRSLVTELADLTDEELQQVVQDAELEYLDH